MKDMLPEDRIRRLPVWHGDVHLRPLVGGITNENYLVRDDRGQFVVRLGGDIPPHHVMRFNEQAASRAAADAGISPAVRHAESDALVIDFIPSAALAPTDVRARIAEIVPLIARVHRDMAPHLKGPALSYWIFHIVRDNLHTLAGHGHGADLARLGAELAEIEAALGPQPVAFCHNDLLAANILDDGKRLWLIDWDYAGWNTPLFDLACLASNNEFTPDMECAMLEAYHDRPTDGTMMRDYLALKAAALLKETCWSMVSEGISAVDFDYVSYSALNMGRYRAALDDLRQA